ncbi:Ger(x)C family spore germination protein [Lederbergia wuyishanensis]|uniref:Spore germination protein KC n=1 Tax=Lederbergia wuyishanensis TaxID=1347903 RepID=A0ABU0D911_9BACI|nr:Ger(x)C family spore germination protein [Lederbergia wuyishanensis]MCJ8007557.1 Ger(x)C family spore germination protein [Lederbergia wuyishanensis]MDQ0344862.1 spore germination protein KC [Lederbergia wuyishanensis]
MFRRIVSLFCLIVLVIPLLSGCWDSLDIEKRATVLAISIDKAKMDHGTEHGSQEEKQISNIKGHTSEEDSHLIQLTAQIAVPGRIPLGPQIGGGGGEGQKPVWVLSVVGSSLDSAMTNLQQELSDKLFLGHLRVIILSEEIAKEGVGRFNDYLRRQSEVRRTAWMAVSKGKASSYMNVAPELERVPALYLNATVENSVKLGKFPNNPVGAFWRIHASKGQDAFLPYLEIKQGGNINLEGLAYFKGDKMKGHIAPIQIGLQMALIQQGEGGYAAFYTVPGTNEQVLLRAMKRRAKFKTAIRNGKPEIWIRIRYENEIIEKEKGKIPINNPKIIKKIEKKFNKEDTKAMEKLIKKMQKEKSDIFGFGEHIRARHPSYWSKHVKTLEDWQNIYKNDLSVHVQVESQILRTGMKAK